MAKKEENKLSSPFDIDFKSKEFNFNEERIRKKLEKIFPEKDYFFIDHILNDKKYYYPNALKIERGIFRDCNGSILQVIDGNEKGFNIPQYIVRFGKEKGLGTISHNHINGLAIPSLKDLISAILLQSKYNHIYTPNKNGLLTNNNSSLNKDSRKEIVEKYENYFVNKKNQIMKMLIL